MAQATTKDLTTLPVGRLGLIPLISCKDLGEKVNEWLIQWRKERSHEELDSFAFEGYQRESYLIPVQTARFGSGEAKCTIMESVRGDDIYLMVDVCNYSLTYSIGPYENLMSPDDHFQDLKRVIGAIGGKARRVNVIMPYLYESRQNIRSGRESLDCATALQELVSMGVENIITFDAHDARVQNATPLHGFETIQPSYQFIKALLNHEKGVIVPQVKEQLKQMMNASDRKPVEAEETEGNAQEEIRRMVIPTWSAAQIAETARSQGDAPDIVRDDVTKVTLFDYSDIIADEKPVYPQKQTSEE